MFLFPELNIQPQLNSMLLPRGTQESNATSAGDQSASGGAGSSQETPGTQTDSAATAQGSATGMQA